VSNADWLDPDELRTIRAFHLSARAVFTQLDRDLQHDLGIPRTYVEILLRLQQAPGHALRMSELADLTESKASRITHAVGRLEQAGHVRRELSPQDRRGWFAVLTERGAGMLKLAAPQYARSVRKHFFALLSPTERDQLTRIGETLLDHLNPSAAPIDLREASLAHHHLNARATTEDEHRHERAPGDLPDQVGVPDA
jgi:DNA-binding MarR family transcriptional regulator